MEQVRGADWCKVGTLQWSDCRFYGRNRRGPTLIAAYDAWVAETASAAACCDSGKLSALGGCVLAPSASALAALGDKR